VCTPLELRLYETALWVDECDYIMELGMPNRMKTLLCEVVYRGIYQSFRLMMASSR
jgi:hypothetical protein